MPLQGFIELCRREMPEPVCGDHFAVEAHAPHGLVDRAVGEWSLRVPVAAKDVPSPVCKRNQLPQQINGLARQGHGVRLGPVGFLVLLPQLHAGGRDGPERLVEVQLLPFHGTDLARSLEEHDAQLERNDGPGFAGIRVACPEQAAQVGRVLEGRVVAARALGQGSPQVGGHVAAGDAGADRIGVDLLAVRPDAMRGVDDPAALHSGEDR